MISRRALIAACAAAPASAFAQGGEGLLPALAALERSQDGRLGVAILDTDTGRIAAWRGQERFALCSTHKLLTAACVLARVDRGTERLDRRIVYGPNDLVAYSPLTSGRIGPPGLTVGELCAASLTVSDNTAANLLLDCVGGPSALTLWLRTLGDGVTRLDRRETALNDATPGDPRDTTTPLAMLHLLRQTVLGSMLSPTGRAQLTAWLADCRTGGRRLRAGAPPYWRAGDKTGSGGHGATNDVAVFWPPGRPPILVTAYLAESAAPKAAREAVLMQVGRLATAG